MKHSHRTLLVHSRTWGSPLVCTTGAHKQQVDAHCLIRMICTCRPNSLDAAPPTADVLVGYSAGGWPALTLCQPPHNVLDICCSAMLHADDIGIQLTPCCCCLLSAQARILYTIRLLQLLLKVGHTAVSQWCCNITNNAAHLILQSCNSHAQQL